MFGSKTIKRSIIVASILFFTLFFHLIGVYLYDGGHYEGVKGGSISIGTVGNPPNPLDPFVFGGDDSANLLYKFLFRGLIRYDVASGVYMNDLAQCDFADLNHIVCVLSDDAVWSDGTRVKIEDILASLDAFEKRTSDPDIATLLKNTKIVKNGEKVEFSSKEKNPRIMEILSYPVVRSDVIRAIKEKTITPQNYITSGPYIFSEKVTDETYGFERITLSRNERWRQTLWLDKIHFKFFRDLPTLERSTEALTVIIPPAKNEKLDLDGRFHEYRYTNNEYFSVFFNTQTMNRVLRNTIHWQIGTSFGDDILDDHKRVTSIFSTGNAILPTEGIKNFPDVLRGNGYIKKSEYLAKTKDISTTVSGEVQYDRVKYWTTKGKTSPIFITEDKDEMILTGKAPTRAQIITVNGYTLKEFIPGNPDFAYKVSRSFGTLKEGKNTYKVVFSSSGGILESETLTLYMSGKPENIAQYKQQVQDAYNATLNTPALVATREKEKQEKIKQIEALGDEYYYNEKNQIFQIKIAYVTGLQSTEKYATNIEKSLKLLGIKTELIPYGIKDIELLIKTGKKNYDILVIGVSLEGGISFANTKNTTANLNFSSIDNKNLDTLFAELQTTTKQERIEQIEQGILAIMNRESFFLPLSSPYHRIWVDRNIKGIPFKDKIPHIENFSDIFLNTSIKQNYILSLAGKTFGGFFSWMIGKI